MAPPPTDLPRPGAEGPALAPAPADDAPGAVVTREIEAMAAAWRRGEQPRAEAYLARHPEFSDEDAVRLIYEEACLRQEAGQESVSAEILGRFPKWRSKLALLLDCHRLLWAPPGADFPDVGADLGDFRLLAEVGRGAHGRTYLASQRSLAHRLMVLKVTPLDHDEHLSLARLQHMHIVPLYLEQVFPDRNIRVLGMPYLGGTTLARVLDALGGVPAAERSGRQILDALDDGARSFPAEAPPDGPFRKYLARATYVQAICWLGACLADALQYAHDRGLVHMDVKASNVLIAGDGQPMLLDFHLARGPVGPGLPVPDRLGGTPEFMAPEQHAAMAAVLRGGAIAAPVDGRADLYSLGLLLYEALGGDPGTGRSAARRPLEACNPKVSPGLSDIVRKCLAHDPRQRYPDAAALARDLRRHLSDLPLRGVANRSLAERWRKWRRRRPAALVHGVLGLAGAAAVLAALAVPAVQLQGRARRAEAALDEGRGLLGDRRYAEAARAFRRGLELAGHLPDQDGRKQALHALLQRARGEQAVAELHDLVDLLRFRYGVSPPPGGEAEALFRRGLEVWERRALFAPPDGGPPDPARAGQVRADFLDLATILADLRATRGAGERSDEALRDAVQILLDAERQFGPGPALRRELRRYAQDLGRADLASVAVPAPRSAWEHYDLGRSYLRSGEYARAEQEFRQAVALQPGEFWPYFFQGVCAYRLGRYQDAASALNVCVALEPRAAGCYYNRAKVFEALGQPGPARDDYSRALALEPGLTDAALNRGILAFREGRHADALADFERARATARGGGTLGLILYNQALVHVARQDWPAARASLEQAIALGDGAALDLYARIRGR